MTSPDILGLDVVGAGARVGATTKQAPAANAATVATPATTASRVMVL